MILVLLKGTNSLSHYLTQQSKDFSEQASIDFQTTQETQHYSSTGDGHHPLIWPETLNRSRQTNPHFAYLHAKQSNVCLYPRVFLEHQTHHSEATYNLCSDFG